MTTQPATPTDDDLGDDPDGARPVLIALAICCTVPMIGIVVMTSVLGIALGGQRRSPSESSPLRSVWL